MKTINEIQACFLISLIAHTGLIGSGVFHFNSVKQEKPFEVAFEAEEEILPEEYEVKEEKKIEDPVIEKEEAVEPVLEESAAEQPPEPAASEDELKKSLLRYQDSIKQKIQQEKQYPRWALRNGREGVVRISFNLLSSGKINDIRLLESSGTGELDTEAMDAVKRASPFLPIPSDFGRTELQFEFDMVFRVVTER